MKQLIAFDTEEEIYEILGWKYTGDFWKDKELHDKLWDADFNLDDWDWGFCCKEPVEHTVTDEDSEYWTEFDHDVHWLMVQMDCYCCGYHHCEFGGYHWYTVHHA